MTKREAGRKGGKSTASKYGAEYMREIGRRGAVTLHQRYSFQPVEQSSWALVRRSDGIIVRVFGNAYLDSRRSG